MKVRTKDRQLDHAIKLANDALKAAHDWKGGAVFLGTVIHDFLEKVQSEGYRPELIEDLKSQIGITKESK